MEDVLKTLLEERYILAAVLAAVLIMLVTERGLSTSKRMLEWKERAERYEKEKREMELSARETATELERLGTILEVTNELIRAFLRQGRNYE